MRTGALHPGFAGQPGVLEDETTIAQVLSGAGYVTQAIGKWHCGEDGVAAAECRLRRFLRLPWLVRPVHGLAG